MYTTIYNYLFNKDNMSIISLMNILYIKSNMNTIWGYIKEE